MVSAGGPAGQRGGGAGSEGGRLAAVRGPAAEPGLVFRAGAGAGERAAQQGGTAAADFSLLACSVL